MKRTLFLLLLLAAAVTTFGQDAKALYQERFSYDLKQDKESIIFDGKTFWLRMSSLKDDALTLTYFLKGETPTTATELLTVLLAAPGETLSAYSGKLVERTKPLTPTPAEIIIFDQFQGGEQRLVTFIIEDKTENLVQDTMVRLTQWDGKRLTAAFHSIRLKLSDVRAKPDAAVAKVGDRRQERMQAVTYLSLPF